MAMRRSSGANRYRANRFAVGGRGHWCVVILCGLMFLAGTVLMVGELARAYRCLSSRGFFPVRTVEVEGLSRLRREQIIAAAGIVRGQSLLSIHLDACEKRIERIPWARWVRVSLNPAGTVRIVVKEREPVAVVFLNSTPYLMDLDGSLFLKVRVGDWFSLPFLTGVATRDSQRLKLRKRVLEAFLALKDAVELSKWLPPRMVSEYRWKGDEGFLLHLNPYGMILQVGRKSFRKRLGRARDILVKLERRGLLSSVTALDLRYSTRAFVRGRFHFDQRI